MDGWTLVGVLRPVQFDLNCRIDPTCYDDHRPALSHKRYNFTFNIKSVCIIPETSSSSSPFTSIAGNLSLTGSVISGCKLIVDFGFPLEGASEKPQFGQN